MPYGTVLVPSVICDACISLQTMCVGWGGVLSGGLIFLVGTVFQGTMPLRNCGKQNCRTGRPLRKEPGNRPRSGRKMRFYYVNQPKSEKIKLRNCGKLKILGSLMVDEDCMPSSAALLQKRLSGSIDMADIGTDID